MTDPASGTTGGLRAAVEALAERWADVLVECKQADPRWILDRSVTTLDTALRELRAALAAHAAHAAPASEVDAIAAVLAAHWGCGRGEAFEGHGAICASGAHNYALYGPRGCQFAEDAAAAIVAARSAR